MKFVLRVYGRIALGFKLDLFTFRSSLFLRAIHSLHPILQLEVELFPVMILIEKKSAEVDVNFSPETESVTLRLARVAVVTPLTLN